MLGVVPFVPPTPTLSNATTRRQAQAWLQLRDYQPTTASEVRDSYELGMGQLVVDNLAAYFAKKPLLTPY